MKESIVEQKDNLQRVIQMYKYMQDHANHNECAWDCDRPYELVNDISVCSTCVIRANCGVGTPVKISLLKKYLSQFSDEELLEALL